MIYASEIKQSQEELKKLKITLSNITATDNKGKKSGKKRVALRNAKDEW